MGIAEALCRTLERVSRALKSRDTNNNGTSRISKPDTALQLVKKGSQKPPVKK